MADMDLPVASLACASAPHSPVPPVLVQRPPTQQYVKPEVGKLLVFPIWLLHRVEPFFGEGERRTLSCNLDVEFRT